VIPSGTGVVDAVRARTVRLKRLFFRAWARDGPRLPVAWVMLGVGKKRGGRRSWGRGRGSQSGTYADEHDVLECHL
jgi:hypothetical protein